MILHVVDAVSHGATEVNMSLNKISLSSLKRYADLCRDVNFVNGTGQRHRIIKLQPIV